MNSTGSTYWCRRCDRFITLHTQHIAICPDCGGGFIEGIHNSGMSPISSLSNASTTTTADRPASYNPVIALPTSPTHNSYNYHLYYYDGSGYGLRPIPATIEDFLMSSGFDRILHQLGQLGISGSSGVVSNGFDSSPVSKAAVENLPVVEIGDSHLLCESHCAVCKEMFEVGTEARELPCKHIYHFDCIKPWLLMHNSCPVCRFKLPCELSGNGDENAGRAIIGLRIWRLPGGGFAVGRFIGGRGGGDGEGRDNGEFPVVYTEMDGGFESHGGARRVSWPVRARRDQTREQGRRSLSRVVRGFLSLFRRSGSSSVPRSRRILRNRREGWTFGV